MLGGHLQSEHRYSKSNHPVNSLLIKDILQMFINFFSSRFSDKSVEEKLAPIPIFVLKGSNSVPYIRHSRELEADVVHVYACMFLFLFI